MTTATTTSPLESYKEGRDSFLAAVLGAVSGLETSVLHFQNQHNGQLRASGAELADAQREKAQLEWLVGEQALELEACRSHAGTAVDPLDVTAGQAPSAEARAEADVAARTIADLRTDLEIERGLSAGLRGRLEEAAGEIARLGDVEGQLQEATTRSREATETQESFELRLATAVHSAESEVRGEGLRVIEAIAADNPALADAAEMFTIAFRDPETPGDGARQPAPAATGAPELSEDFFASLPAPALASAPAAPLESASLQGEVTVEPPASTALEAMNAEADPEAADDVIMDPSFFDTPVPLEEPAAAPDLKEEPQISHGFFGRKKDAHKI